VVRLSSTERGYGSRWQKAAAAYLAAHPIAVDYFATHAGVVYAAEVVDHIIPHRGDMTLFWGPTNWQGLTKADHDRKTASEDGGFGRAAVNKRSHFLKNNVLKKQSEFLNLGGRG
jgi:5-methylcytosine-specific restriction enzyme A